MRILIFHGYLLRGTGSNVYNASLAQALARLGHEVHLLCQDREAASLDWVDRVGRWSNGRLELEPAGGGSGPGTVTAYVPDIGGLLPVYVDDPYEGFRVKTFAELTDAELDAYLDANVARRPRRRRGARAASTPRSPTISSWARRSSPAPASPSPRRSTARRSSTR